MDHFPENLSELMTPNGPALAWGKDENGLVIVQLREQKVRITTEKGYTYETRVARFAMAEVEPLAAPTRKPAPKATKVEQVSAPDTGQLALLLP